MTQRPLTKLLIPILMQQTFPFNKGKTETLSTMNILFMYNMYIYMFQLFLFSGPYNVIINPGKSFRRLKFRLKAKASSRKTQGILCENGNYVFMSIGLRSLRFKTSIILLTYVAIVNTLLLFLDNISPFCESTVTNVLDFWWCLHWFQSQIGQLHLHLAEAYMIHVPWDSPLVQHLPTSWQWSHSLSHTCEQALVGLETGIYCAATSKCKTRQTLYQLSWAILTVKIVWVMGLFSFKEASSVDGKCS